MSLYKKDIAKAIIVVSLVAVLSIGTYFLFPEVLPKVMYVAGATIQDDASATEDFIAGIRESGGAYISIASCPSMQLTFENRSVSIRFITVLKNQSLFWSIIDRSIRDNRSEGRIFFGDEIIINASGLQEFNVNWGHEKVHTYPSSSHEHSAGPESDLSGHFTGRNRFSGSFSGKFENLSTGGTFDWYGNYNRGNEINTALYVDSNRTDLGTCFADDNPFVLHFNMIGNTTLTWVYGTYHGTSGPASWETGPCWEEKGWGEGWGADVWSMQIGPLLQMVGESKSASISFEGSAWVDGDYTAIENGTVRNETLNSKKNVSFGTIDVTFENGLISTLTFKLKLIDIILFARPQED